MERRALTELRTGQRARTFSNMSGLSAALSRVGAGAVPPLPVVEEPAASISRGSTLGDVQSAPLWRPEPLLEAYRLPADSGSPEEKAAASASAAATSEVITDFMRAMQHPDAKKAADAMLSLGLCFEEGCGVEANAAIAQRWYNV